jgi:hypothetical protein
MVNFALEEAMKTQREVEVWVYSLFNLGTRWLVVNATPRPLYLRE